MDVSRGTAAVEPRDYFALNPSNARLPCPPFGTRVLPPDWHTPGSDIRASHEPPLRSEERGSSRAGPHFLLYKAVRSQAECRKCQQRRPNIDNYFAVIYDVHAKELLALLLCPGQQRPLAPVVSHITGNCADFDISVIARSKARLSVQLHERPTTRCARGYSLLEAACR